MTGNSFPKRVYDVIKQFPEGLIAAEIASLFPDEGGTKNLVFSTLNNMKGRKLIKVIGKRVSAETGYKCAVYGVDRAYDESPRSVSRVPTNKGLQARLDAANAKIAELEAWKSEAIQRFPDLAVGPALVAARKKVAAMFRSEGDSMKADAVMKGQHDNTPIVRLAASLIEEMAA